MRRATRHDKKDALEMKAPLRGVRHGQMAQVNRVECSAEKADAANIFRRAGAVVAAPRLTIAPRERAPGHPEFRWRRRRVNPRAHPQMGQQMGQAPGPAVRVPRPWRGLIPGFPLQWRRRWREIRGRHRRNTQPSDRGAPGQRWHRAWWLRRWWAWRR